jgi:branched-subunit amino acid aminotransferase/4-amino-4-deoxychorismate lyase
MSEIVILPAGDKAEFLPTASSFAYGYGLFETLRFDAGRLLHWEAHWARLCASARALGIRCDYSEAGCARRAAGVGPHGWDRARHT